MPRLAAAILLALAGAACAGNVPPPPPAAPAQLVGTLVVLHTGPRTEPLTDDERRQVFGGHFANMERLARAGHLLLAGPYGRTRTSPTLRGVFVFDTGDPERARQLAESDPGFAAGVFRFEYHACSTRAPLRAFLAADLARRDAIAATGRTPQPGEGGRGYVWLRAEQAEAAERALAGHPAVLLAARLDGTHALMLLDAADVAAAQALLAPHAGAIGPHRLDDWYGSGLLAELPRLAAGS